MLGVKKLRHFYALIKCPLVNAYIFITQKIDVTKICAWQILMVPLQSYAKISFKRLLKSLSYLFYPWIPLQNFSSRPYPNVKIILAFF